MQFPTIIPLAFLLDKNIFFCTLFWNTLSVYSYFDVRDQVSQVYETTDKIIDFSYIKIYEE
jgi:hypothetical protein